MTQPVRFGILAATLIATLLIISGRGPAWAWQQPQATPTEPADIRKQAAKLKAQGNWQDAFKLLEPLLVSPQSTGQEVAQDLKLAQECLQQLGLAGRIDDVLKKTLAVHGENWQVLAAAAKALMQSPHHGAVVGQQFHREPREQHGNSRWVQTIDADRQQALIWLEKALRLAGDIPANKPADATPANAAPDKDPTNNPATPAELAGLWEQVTSTLLLYRDHRQAWRLLARTPLDQAPDYTDDEASQYGPQRYASVDQNGRPIFWKEPESWQAAQSDAERLRFALKRVSLLGDPASKEDALLHWANLLHSQFSVDTLQEQMWLWNMRGPASSNAEKSGDEIKDEPSGILSVHTLKDNETIAKLANGIQRFELPDEFNPLRIFQQLASSERAQTRQTALFQLLHTYLNRRQYPKAVTLLKEHIQRWGDTNGILKTQLDNIVQPRGAFDPVKSQPAGQPAQLSLLFRNAKSVAFSARQVDLEQLLRDFKQWHRDRINNQANNRRRPSTPDMWSPPFYYPQPFFHAKELKRYVGPPVATWSQELEPRENHWDRRITIHTPLTKGGLYVIDAVLDDTHTARCALWINDMAIAHKAGAMKDLIFVADAISGTPIAGANVEFFGYGGGEKIESFAKKTDNQGQILLPDQADHNNHQWLFIARDARGRIAFSGQEQLTWNQGADDNERFDQWKAYGVADQPVHRPGDKLRAKLWLGQANYKQPRPLAKENVTVRALDPKGIEIWNTTRMTDAWGAVEVELELPPTATLGMYTFEVRYQNQTLPTNLMVRVEEFRKPEFEVTVEAPDKPVRLGEKIDAKIKAKYYFGTPVTDAVVNVRVTRQEFVDTWYPVRPFDWCFGPGYWWYAYDYPWYPNWHSWRGCFAPMPTWAPWNATPPEVVLEQELTLDKDGTATLTIDTSIAAQLQGKQDHRYDISVEVRDASRRTITANGSVVASRQPFKIYSWLDRGFYRINETIDAHFIAQTLDRKPVQAAGKLELLRITYDAQRQPQETVVADWDARSDENGQVNQRMVVRRGGQYRLRLRLTDEGGHEVEGAYLFTVRGDNQTADNFRFTELELIPNKAEYAPGEQVELQINADRADATVLLFVRPHQGPLPPARVIKLVNKTARVTIDVVADDQPNFFVEAFTIYNGNFYSATREIFVPPTKRILNVSLEPDQAEYLPGGKANLNIQVKDSAGKPVAGPVLVAIYDRALEQIAGDVLPPDIREFFWKWRRSYFPFTSHNLTRVLHPMTIEGTPVLTTLGIFGATLADDADQLQSARGYATGVYDTSGGMGGGGMEGGMGGMGGGMGRSLGARMPGGMGGAMEGMRMMAAPAPAMAMDAGMAKAGAPPEAAATAPAKLRKDFADSALWLTNVQCDRNGQARVEYTMPENLSDWQMRSWAVGAGLEVGSAAATAVTHKHILVRLTTPRFLTERDQVVLSAIVHNDFKTAQDVKVRLEIDGQTQLQLANGTAAEQTLRIEGGQQARVDWPCLALAEGEVTVRAYAESSAESDAMQLKLPIIIHGLLKTESWAGTVRADQAVGSIRFTVPEERRPKHSKLTVRLSPSLAAAMVDALPYLVDYPYGCTEQTLNRFLPTIMTQRMLIDLNVDLEQIKLHRNNLNAQELGGTRNPADRRPALPKPGPTPFQKFQPARQNPVFDSAEVARMVERGVQRLTDMQNADGGWGWFSGSPDPSSPHTSATVVRGLLIARENGAAIVPDVIDRGLNFLEQYQQETLRRRDELAARVPPIETTPNNDDAFVFYTLALGGRANETMENYLFEKRSSLSVYGKTLLAWATHKLGHVEQTNMLRQNIEQFLVEDAENETAYLRDQSPWWYWYGSQIESTAMYLKLLAALEPKGRVAPRLVKYLLNNRRHDTYWTSTRDTALVVEAFADYIRGRGEMQSNVTGEVWLDEKRLGSVAFTPTTMFTADTTIEIAGNAVPSGQHTLEIRRQGAGPLFFSTYLSNFTLEDEITPAGLEVKIERRYYRLDPVQKSLDLPDDRGQLLERQRSAYQRVLIDDLQAVPVGTLVEVELQIDSKNDYEYLMIEERKAAGLEPVDTQSGYHWDGGQVVYREMREKHVAFFFERLSRGQHILRYQLRSEVLGQFTALPAVISGMYAPELVGNSSDQDLRVSP